MFLPMGIVMSLNPGGVEALFKYLALVKYNLIDYQYCMRTILVNKLLKDLKSARLELN